MIRVLLVDDSSFIRTQLRLLINDRPDFLVVGEAKDGKEAVEITLSAHPDVIVMDVDMPVMDGLEATRRIMESRPTPILIQTSSAISRKRNLPFEAINCGALEVVEKPQLYPLEEDQRKEFFARLSMLSKVHVVRRSPKPSVLQPSEIRRTIIPPTKIPKLLAITASTGGPKALRELLQALPPVVPFPVLIVQHIGAVFVEGLREWLQNFTGMQIQIASDNEPLQANICYLSPGDIHLTVRLPFHIRLDDSPPMNSSKPSADLLFHSVRRICGSQAVGVILTGIGQDGAEGLLELRSAGAITIAQSEESAVTPGMPRRAIERQAATYVGGIEEISMIIQRVFRIAK